MAVRPGYKQTDVGVIPEDWAVKPLGDLFEITSSKRVFQSEWKTHGVPFYRARELAVLGESGSVSNELFITREMYERFARDYGVPVAGDMLVTGVGTLGKTYVVAGDHEFYFKDGNIIWFKLGESVTSEFLRQLYLTPVVIKQIGDGSAGTTVGTYTISSAKKTRIPLPPKSEQHAIAAALRDVDALLRGLERLIGKKHDLKQAAFQQLLTGQTRLPGFNGNWEFKRLGNLFEFSGGYAASRDQLSTAGYCYLHYGDIHGSKKTYVDTSADYQDIPKLDVPLKRVPPSSLLRDGDIVFVDASEDDEGASKHVVVVNKGNVPFISGLHTIVAKPRTSELAHEYLRYCFKTAAIREQFLFYAVGTKVTGISKKNIANLTLPVPSLDEQSVIAGVLSDMDADLSVLEARLDKTRALKRAMTQELLTGRTRFVATEGTDA